MATENRKHKQFTNPDVLNRATFEYSYNYSLFVRIELLCFCTCIRQQIRDGYCYTNQMVLVLKGTTIKPSVCLEILDPAILKMSKITYQTRPKENNIFLQLTRSSGCYSNKRKKAIRTLSKLAL